MAGRVEVDTPAEHDPGGLKLSRGWLAGLAGLVVLVLLMLPGEPAEETPPVVLPHVEVPEVRWTPLDLPGRPLLAVAEIAGERWVAVGVGPQIWLSEDATEWRQVVADEAAIGALVDVTPFDGGAVAVGTIESGVGVIMTSFDGESWIMSLRGEPGVSLTGTVSTPEGVLAWGRDNGWNSRLFHSEDGLGWTRVEPPKLDIATAVYRAGSWYVGGSSGGRPRLYRSDDLYTWWLVNTADLPPGSRVIDVSDDPDDLVLTLSSAEGTQVVRWDPGADTDWSLDALAPGHPVDGEDAGMATDGSALWQLDGTEWSRVEIEGEVAEATSRVAVGEREGSAMLWVRDPESPLTFVPVNR